MPLKARVDGPVMEFDKLEVGETLPEMRIVYDEDMQGRFLAALQEENPWYYNESPWGGPLTYHPLLDDAPMEAAMHRYQYPFSFVHARQETDFINPLAMGPGDMFSRRSMHDSQSSRWAPISAIIDSSTRPSLKAASISWEGQDLSNKIKSGKKNRRRE